MMFRRAITALWLVGVSLIEAFTVVPWCSRLQKSLWPFYAESEADNDQELYRQLDETFDYQGRLKGSYTDYRCGFVSVLGAPNMGKSTLVNALLQEDLCIATARPQTTRHAILGLLTTDTCQVCLVDTPGVIDQPAYKLQEGMMEAVAGAFRDSDVLLIVTDLFSTPIPNDAIFAKVQQSSKPILVAINKIDLADKVNPESQVHEGKTLNVAQAVLVWRQLLPSAVAIVPVSAANGGHDPGVVALRRIMTGGEDVPSAIRALGRPIPGMFHHEQPFLSDDEARGLLPLSPPLYDGELLTDRPERFIASEMIRAALFESLKKELPYCCEVQISEFKEPKDGDAKPVIRIGAAVIVERESQKVIVIGKGGEQIKKVGTAARKKLEDFFQTKVRGSRSTTDTVATISLLISSCCYASLIVYCMALSHVQVYLNLSVKVNKDWRKKEDALKEFGYMP